MNSDAINFMLFSINIADIIANNFIGLNKNIYVLIILILSIKHYWN